HEFLSGTYQVGYIAGYSQCCADERAAANRKKNLGRSGKVAARREGHWLAPILPLPRQRLEELVKLVNHPFRKAGEAGRNVEPVRNRGPPAALSSLELGLLARFCVACQFGYTVIARIEAYQKIVRRSEYYEFLLSQGWPLVTLAPAQLKAAYYNLKTRQKRASKGR